MKHSLDGFLALAYAYFPPGTRTDDPAYAGAEGAARQRAVRIAASQRCDAWCGMLDRLQARFPEGRYPGIQVNDCSPFLKDPTVEPLLTRCFTGRLSLPPRNASERQHFLELLVSFVVPYYVIGSVSIGFPPDPGGMFGGERRRSFALTANERPFADAIVEEISAAFPDHAAIAPEVGQTVVPDVRVGNKCIGEATVFTCLFSQSW